MTNLIIIDNRVDDIDIVIKSLNSSTNHIILDYYSDSICDIKNNIL